MSEKFDVIIIGAGIGGLAAGTFLSKNGYRVLIIEKQRYAGGYCSSFKRGDFIFDSAAHVVGSYNKHCSFWKLLTDLDVEVDLIRLSPTDIIRFHNEELIEIPLDYKKYADFLKRRFNKEESHVDDFFAELHKMTNPFYAASLVKKYSGITYQQYLDSFFTDPKLKGILSVHCGFVGLPPVEASALSALFTLKMFIIEGAYYPRGGAQSLANAFVSRFKMNNGEILFNNEVSNILIERGSVKGVKVGTGKRYVANVVISNIDCKSTYQKLIDSKGVEVDIGVKNTLNKFKIGMSCFMIYLATNANVETQRKNGWYFPSFDINKSFSDLLYLHIPSNYDKSVAKNGCNIIVLVVPYVDNVAKITNWEKIKNNLTVSYLEKLKHIFPNLGSNILHMDAATPNTLERYTSNALGSAYGWKQTPDQMYANAFPSISLVKGLFLAGHWTFPGGGVVSAALSGVNAARHIMKSRAPLDNNVSVKRV